MKHVSGIFASVLILTVTLAAVAQESKPAPVARVSVSSIDQVNKTLMNLNLALPFLVNPAGMIEQQFPFIGQGGLRTDLPVGLIFVAGDKLTQQQMCIFLLPVKEGKASLAGFKQTGAQPVPGQADMVSMGQAVHFRRTANYLMMYPGAPQILAIPKEQTLTNDFVPGRLISLSLDLASLRKAAPMQYRAFLANLNKNVPPTSDPARALGQKKGVEFVHNCIEGLDRLSLAIGTDPQNLLLETWIYPFDAKATRSFPQPAFPDSIIGRMDIVYPDAESAAWIDRIMQQVPETAPFAKQTPEQAKQFKEILAKMLHLLLAPDAQSAALEMKGGKPVGYIVNQYATDVDMAKEVQGFAAALNAMGKEAGEGDLLKYSTYQNASGKSVSHLSFMEKGVAAMHLDFIQNGHVVVMAAAQDEGKYIEAVSELAMKGEMSNLCSGNISLAAALKAAQESNAAPLPPQAIQEMNAAFAGQSITWLVKAKPQTKGLYVKTSIPFAALKVAGKFLMAQPAQPAAEPMPVK